MRRWTSWTSAVGGWVLAVCTPALAQPVLGGGLVASDGGSNELFGRAVAASGDLALVGASYHSAAAPFSGAAYLFQLSTRTQVRKLVAPDGAASDWFGASVALSGDRALVGAPGADPNGSASGAAYLFAASTGQLVAKLLPGDGAAKDSFGLAVAMTDAYALVGAPEHGPKGAAYLFDAQTGAVLHKLAPAFGLGDETFGAAVAVSGDRIVVGAPSAAPAGAVYVFDAVSGALKHRITPPLVGVGFDFGAAVAVAADRVVIGAPHFPSPGPKPGAAFGYDPASGSQRWVATSPQGVTAFGARLAMTGTTAVVGGIATVPGTGALQAFGAAWGAPEWTVDPQDLTEAEGFGDALAMTSRHLVVGAPTDGAQSPAQGSAYVFDTDVPMAYGSGCPGTLGVEVTLSGTGQLSPGGAYQLCVEGGQAGQSAFLVFGAQPAAVPIGFGCTLNVAPLFPLMVGPIPLSGGGGAGCVGAVVPPSAPVPVTVAVQAFVVGAGGGYANSPGATLTFE